MGAENPTGTDTKVETERPEPSDQPPPPPPDRPGSPGQPSRLESRAAAQSPPEAEEREAPPLTRSARAERSTDPNDDPNRVGTPRADSRREAAERDGRTSHQEPPREQQGSGEDSKLGKPQRDTQPPQVSTTEAEQPTADRETERREEPPTPGDGEEPDHRTPEHGVEDREKPETRPADETRPEPDDEFSPAPDASATGEPAAADAPRVEDDVPLLDHDMPEPGKQGSPASDVSAPDEPAAADAPRVDDDGLPLDHGVPASGVEDREGVADGRQDQSRPEPGGHASPASDAFAAAEPADGGIRSGDKAPLLDQRASESDTEASERIADGQTDLGREREPSFEEAHGEQPVEPDREAIEESEPGNGDHDRGRNTEEPRDRFTNLPTRADLDPAGVGVWTSERGDLAPVNEDQDLTEPDPEKQDRSRRLMRALRDNPDDMQRNLNDMTSDLGDALPKPGPPSGKSASSVQASGPSEVPHQGIQGADVAISLIAGIMITTHVYRAAKSKVDQRLGRRSGGN